jgi:hypothetical protein
MWFFSLYTTNPVIRPLIDTKDVVVWRAPVPAYLRNRDGNRWLTARRVLQVDSSGVNSGINFPG